MGVSTRALLASAMLTFCGLLPLGAHAEEAPDLFPPGTFEREPFTYDGDVITLRFSHFSPPTSPLSKAVTQKWVDMVEEESNGKIKIQSYLGGTLHGARDGFKAAVNDITDFTAAYTMYQPSSFRLPHALDLPFAFPSSAVASKVAEELYPKYFKKEYEAMGVYLAQYAANGSYNLFTKKPVRTLADMKGMKIRAAGGVSSEIIKHLGGSPVNVTAPEAYNAFQRGVVDGVMLYDSGAISYRIHEIAKYMTEVKVNHPANAWAFNKKTFDNLPPDVQRFMYNMMRRLSQMYGVGFDAQDVVSRKKILDSGVELIQLPPEEVAKWHAAVEPIWDEFIEKNEAKGLPAGELVKDLREKSAKYASWTPEQLLKEATQNPVGGIISGM